MVQLFNAPPRQKSDPVIPQDKPVYRILSEKGFFGPNDSLYSEGSIIVLWDIPNEDMEPMNQMAMDAFEKYIDKLEESDRIVAEKNGRSFLGRRSKEEIIANASEDARRIQTLSGGAGVPLMGAKKKGGKKRIASIDEQEVPDTGRKTDRGIEVIG